MPRVTKFKCLLVDPPWPFGDKLPGKGRGAAKNYKVMSVEDICRFPLPPLADDAYLLMWRVAAMQAEALEVVRVWGFKLKSEIVWEKLTKTGKPWFGMGRHVRASHETCLVAVRGKPQPLNKNVRSRFAAKVPVGPDGKYIHSAKPAEFYGISERLAAGPRVELFARQRQNAWTQFGDQLK